jgi:hypothetical protein
MANEVIGYYIDFLTAGGQVTLGPHPYKEILEIKKKYVETVRGEQMFTTTSQMSGHLWQNLDLDPRAVFGVKIYREPPNPNKKIEEMLDKLNKDIDGDEPWKNS